MIASAACLTLLASAARAETPFADYCEGNVCFQGKVQRGCMTPAARALMRTISERFGKIEVASACDGRHARQSAHYAGKAFDFRPFQAKREEVVAFLKASPDVGGVGTYSNGLIHADVGDRKMAWHGRGGRAWPIGVDRALDAPLRIASADPAASGGLGAAFLSVFQPLTPSPEPSEPLEEIPSAEAIKAAERIPLPPPRPALLVAAAAARAAVTAGPTDFAAVLRGPLDPAMPILLHDASSESAAAPEQHRQPVSFYRDDPLPVRARIIAYVDLR